MTKILQVFPSEYAGQLPRFVKAMRLTSAIDVFEQCGEDYREAWQSHLFTLTEADGDLDALFEDDERLKYWAWLKMYGGNWRQELQDVLRFLYKNNIILSGISRHHLSLGAGKNHPPTC